MVFRIYKTVKKAVCYLQKCVFAVLTFLCLILTLFCSVSLHFQGPLWIEWKTKAFCRILKKLVVICLTWTGLCPKVKKNKKTKKQKNKKHHKDRLSCICISWHSNSKKQTWETDQPCSQPEIRVFAVSLRRLLGANTRVERPGYVLIVCLRGVREKIRRKGIFSLAVFPLGYARRNKETKERKTKNESIWSKHLYGN